MAKIVVCPNALETEVRENYEFNGLYIDWLQEHYPNGFDGAHITSVNLSKLDVCDYDKVLTESDLVVLLVFPGFEGVALAWAAAAAWWVNAGALTKFIVGTIVSIALNYLANTIFGTAQVKQGKLPNPSPTYDLSVPTNQARLGQPIPVIYGTVVAVPDLAASPYKWYDGNDMWVGLLMCLGQGWHQLNQARISGNPVEQFAPNNFFYRMYSPSDDEFSHNSQFGYMQNSFHTGRFWENVYTAPEVTDQELVSPLTRGPFIASPPSVETDLLSVDIEFPRGLYAVTGGGDIYPWGGKFNWYATPIDDDGYDIGPSIVKELWYSTYDNSGAGYTTPKRFTAWWVVPKARYKCSITRIQHCDNGNCDNVNDSTMVFTAMWTGLKSILYTDPSIPVYGKTTMIAIIARATNGFSQDVLNRFSVNCTRRLPDFRTTEEALITTNSHAHAFYDIYRNSWYGANRPKIEIDLEALEKLYLRSNCLNGFNAVIDTRMTVWEALSLSIAALSAFPATNGAIMSVVEDIAQEVATQCFNESNIVKDSLKLSYKFNDPTTRDGVEVEFRDPEDFEQRFVLTPSTSVEPESINLIGCTNESEALTYSERIWRQRLYRREFIQFATELEGNLPKIGALISIEHELLDGPTCYTIGSINPESDFVVSIEGHRYNPKVYGSGDDDGTKRRVIINIPAIQEGIYDQSDVSVGYARGIKVSGYLTTDVIQVTLPPSQKYTAWSPWGVPNITFTEHPAKLSLSYDNTIHMISMFECNEVHNLTITVDGYEIELLPALCYDAPDVTPSAIGYNIHLYDNGVHLKWPAHEYYVPTGSSNEADSWVDLELTPGHTNMSWSYTKYTWYTMADPAYEDLEIITGSASTTWSGGDNQGATNWFRVLEGPSATSYTHFGTNGGFGIDGRYYSGYSAARNGFIPGTLTGSTEYTFVIEDGNFQDNSGGLSIQLQTL